MKLFRKTWRHEVVIKAENESDATDIWEALDLGNLNKREKDGEIESHEYVEDADEIEEIESE